MIEKILKLKSGLLLMSIFTGLILSSCGAVSNEIVKDSKDNVDDSIVSGNAVYLDMGKTDTEGVSSFNVGIFLESNSASASSSSERTKITVVTSPETFVYIETQRYSIDGEVQAVLRNIGKVKVKEGHMISLPEGMYTVILEKEGYETKRVNNVPIISGQGEYILQEKLYKSFPVSYEMTPTFNNNQWYDTGIDVHYGQALHWETTKPLLQYKSAIDQEGYKAGQVYTMENVVHGNHGMMLIYKIGNSKEFFTNTNPIIFNYKGRLYLKITPFVEDGIITGNPFRYAKDAFGSYTITFSSGN